MKKAQSISINTIVIGAIALVVLIVLIFIFMNSQSDWKKTVENCESLGGVCENDDFSEVDPDDNPNLNKCTEGTLHFLKCKNELNQLADCCLLKP